jgi:DNA-binding beta-propeller fold protein YncE
MKAINILTKLRILRPLRPLFAAAAMSSAFGASDILYIGDQGVNNDSNTVKRFNATTGQYIPGGSPSGVYVAPSSGDLFGPRGLLPIWGKLYVVNQNAGQPIAGEVLIYKLSNGTLEKRLVPFTNAHAPFSPRGMVSWRGVIYVADLVISDNTDDPGRLLAFDEKKGTFLGEFTPPPGFAYPFHPRGLVIGENGLLYVANVPTFPPATGGQVLVFDPETLDFIGAFVSDAGGVGQLNRPEGLVFGPDGNLYITSFRADATSGDTDSIRIYDGSTGVFLSKIDLDSPQVGVGEPRAFAQALLFGHGGKLFVPITGPFQAPSQGQVRRYDVSTGTFDVFVPAGGVLGQPWYLTFEKTDPGTLAYDQHGEHGHHGDRD